MFYCDAMDFTLKNLGEITNADGSFTKNGAEVINGEGFETKELDASNSIHGTCVDDFLKNVGTSVNDAHSFNGNIVGIMNVDNKFKVDDSNPSNKTCFDKMKNEGKMINVGESFSGNKQEVINMDNEFDNDELDANNWWSKISVDNVMKDVEKMVNVDKRFNEQVSEVIDVDNDSDTDDSDATNSTNEISIDYIMKNVDQLISANYGSFIGNTSEVIDVDNELYTVNIRANNSTNDTSVDGIKNVGKIVTADKDLNENKLDIINLDNEFDAENINASNSTKDINVDDIINVDEWEDEKNKNLYQSLEAIFPDASSDYLKGLCDIASFPNQNLDSVISELLVSKDYPKKQNIQIKPETNHTVEASHRDSVKAFLKKYKDPDKHFTGRNVGTAFATSSNSYLREKFRYIGVRTITSVLKRCNHNLTQCFRLLSHMDRDRVTKRSKEELTSYLDCANQDFHDEIFFLENEDEIQEAIEDYKLQMQLAKDNNELLECQCCFNDEVLAEDIMTCIEGHIFCRDCVKRSVEIAFSDGRITFSCLTDCESHFKIEQLEEVLTKNLYSKIQSKIQEAEIKLADVPGICFCPFCDYAESLPNEEKILKCQVCFKESCRYCGEENHIPLGCEEHKQGKIKNSIEAKMTDALVRECYKCKKKFIKQDGCNKMTCVCGARMCYICRQPVHNYTHFDDSRRPHDNQPSTSKQGSKKCPLWSTNNELHVDAIIAAAKDAVAEVQKENPHLNLDTKTFVKGLKRKK